MLKGAHSLLEHHQIGLIYFELIFSKMYDDLPRFHEMLSYLSDHQYTLVSVYDPHFQHNLFSWMDVLYVSDLYYKKWAETERVPAVQERACAEGADCAK